MSAGNESYECVLNISLVVIQKHNINNFKLKAAYYSTTVVSSQ